MQNIKIWKDKLHCLYTHERPNFGVRIPDTRCTTSLCTVYPNTLANPDHYSHATVHQPLLSRGSR